MEARSVARQLPPPVDDHGGFRVDTRSASEVARWVYPAVSPGLVALGQSISQSLNLIKLCGTMDELCAVLPSRWQPYGSGYFMTAFRQRGQSQIPFGYAAFLEQHEGRFFARITHNGGTAASGYAAETEDVFIYDRIETQPLHRRKGLGSAVISLLRSAKTRTSLPEALVATDDGRKLYERLGWQTLSPYSTACVPA